MSAALQRIEETQEALLEALAVRNWEAITQLDLACRECVETVVEHAAPDDEKLRGKLEELLGVYRQLIDVAVGERQAIVDEMSEIQRAKNATKVYHLFG
ncbi:flagellar protein FliT [Pseudomonas sp. 21LCFQ02]|uniref:flagellar protein FliT n=1 Tax=unclassified Pseudomonas TaxID=196821 RepID=UPI0004F73D34|nr:MULTISPECIES: flagellar protein FliT [unclassified Pseudomonas]MCO8163415.1 flagellar protein FliT [Pseudomonas sp. 21LCFQ010]MCO8167332.1 flagellar protein FliT [Pseudomonas sp. 21LCFQ02]MCQ9424915.1 flagellar protein FliT [Pseudomonas sp. LJDD11]BAP44171.1 motility-related protein FliT [Pseudomonas sp. StFLB209]